MSDIQTVLVRDPDGRRRIEADEWTGLTLVAALSADPQTFEELGQAWLRYRPEEPLEGLPWEAGDEEPQGPWLLLDLACQRVVAGGGAELPENPGAFQRDEGPWERDMPVVWINLPPGWECVEAGDWSEALPPLPAPREPLDFRGVLFGRALAEGIARRAVQMARREPLPELRVSWDDLPFDETPDESQCTAAERWHDLTVRVHADWLMTPRDDLEGHPPREFLHRGRDWVDRELSNRQLQWSNESRPPRGLDRDTSAYRHSPVGTHEVVMYFDLCREAIGAAWDRLHEAPDMDEGALAGELHEFAQTWLASAAIDGDPSTTPARIIESERRRMPLTGHGGPLDDDCPLCRMEAEGGFGPAFIGYDGHQLELDDEFAFSLCATREEWERKQQEYRDFDARFEAERSQREADADSPFSSVWSSSHIDEDSIREAGALSPLPTFAMAARVGELVTDLKEAGADRDAIAELNESFDAYRAARQDPALLDAATDDLAETLERLAAAQPRLTPKVADLQSLLDERRRRDLDLPF